MCVCVCVCVCVVIVTTHPGCHTTRRKPGYFIFKVYTSNTNDIHHISRVVEGTERGREREREGTEVAKEEGREGETEIGREGGRGGKMRDGRRSERYTCTGNKLT